MGIRVREGYWHYRFKVNGHDYSGSTDLAATERNKTGALRTEAEARRLVLAGRAAELKLEVKPFVEAADMFLDWTKGEHRDHPATARRQRVSFASLKAFFRGRAVSQITTGDIEDFKNFRRSAHQVRDITIRHDLHALSGFFRYARKHNWTRDNPVREVEIPSGEVIRMHIVTAEEEVLYCCVAELLGLRNLHDQARLMVNQGCRPEEVLEMRPQDIDLVAGYFYIRQGKTDAARRKLQLTAESARILSRRMVAGAKWIFSSPKTPGGHIQKLNNAHAAVLEATGLAFVPYDWRHTFATRAAAKGVPLASLAAILGHANLRSVHKYVHPTQTHMDAAMAMLEAPSPFRPPRSVETGDSEGSRVIESDRKNAVN